jgi:aspartate aminotransferase-like enzyme
VKTKYLKRLIHHPASEIHVKSVRSSTTVPLLMIPGPTNLHPRVLETLALPQVAHTGPQFYSEFLDILGLTKYVFKTSQNVVVFSGSGTSGMEATIASLFEKGDRVLSVENGFFGRRMSTIARIYGVDVETLVFPEGEAATPQALEEKLTGRKYAAVLLTHVETSTGVINPVQELVSVARKNDALAVVDSVCGLGGCELLFDEWGIDVAFAASQKAIAAPPGAVMIALSERATDKIKERKTMIPSYYYNLSKWLEVMKDPRLYLTTPSTAVLRALRVALQLVKEEGLENRWRRHLELSNAFRNGLITAGVEIFSKAPSPTVTALRVSDSASVGKKMLSEHNIMVSRGLDSHKQDLTRVGHMGIVSQKMLLDTLSALLVVLKDLGEPVNEGASLEPLLRLSQ